MGMGALNVLARMGASVGARDAVAPQFVPAVDVPCGGVLFALPALLALGLIDTLKMIACRAKTAMANLLCDTLSHPDDTRALLRALYTTEAALIADYQEHTLTVHLHHMANGYSNDAIRKLCEELNATETLFPRTNLRLVLKLGAAQNPRDQDV